MYSIYIIRVGYWPFPTALACVAAYSIRESTTRPMTIGDSIIAVAVAVAVADASVCADWSIVESDVGVTSVTQQPHQ